MLVSPAVRCAVEQQSLKLKKPSAPLHLEVWKCSTYFSGMTHFFVQKYKELLDFTEEYLSRIISYFLDQKEVYPTFTDATSIIAELQDTLRYVCILYTYNICYTQNKYSSFDVIRCLNDEYLVSHDMSTGGR